MAPRTMTSCSDEEVSVNTMPGLLAGLVGSHLGRLWAAHAMDSRIDCSIAQLTVFAGI